MSKILAADTVIGIYEVGSIPPGVSLYFDEMLEALSSLTGERVIYGIVSDDVAQQIDAEYGISWRDSSI